MENRGLGRIVAEAFARAIPWGIVLSLAVIVTSAAVMAMARQEVKEAIEYSAATTAEEVVETAAHTAANDPVIQEKLLPQLKQDAKEAIEYTVEEADQELDDRETGKRQQAGTSG